jgi:GNAT superfamily N-acetyltransferase
MTEIKIRRFVPQDRAHWETLWQGYNTFYKRSVEPRVTDRLWSRLLENSGEPFGFAAEIDGRAVGLAHYFFFSSTSEWNPRCYLQDLFADPAIRGKGIGRALIEAVYAEADKHEAAQTYWLTQDFNETARRLYDRIGHATPFIKYQR